MRRVIKISFTSQVLYLFFTLLFGFSILQANALAQSLSQGDLNSIYNNTVWYDANSNSAFDCSGGTPVSPGSGAPDGAQFPNLDPGAMANAINKWTAQQNPNSELSGLGSTVVAGAKNSNVNPFLIVAIAKEESSLSDPNDFNVQHGSNSFGRTAAAGQPSFQGSRSWYKWSSVKASVDNTAPENQNAAGGGDIASYIRNQYGAQLDSNNLTAMFLQYAPPGENDTAQYIANVQSWITNLINLANGGTSSGNAPTTSIGGCGTSTSCSSGSTTATGPNAAILCEAEKYAGIYYHLGGGHVSYSAFRQQCPETAIASAASVSTASDPGPCATDCSGLISIALDAVYNQGYVWIVSDANGSMEGGGAQYWKPIPIAQAQAGDIVTTDSPDGHIEIVDHISGNSIVTFGSHHTGTQTGAITTSTSYWVTGAWRWMGPTQ